MTKVQDSTTYTPIDDGVNITIKGKREVYAFIFNLADALQTIADVGVDADTAQKNEIIDNVYNLTRTLRGVINAAFNNELFLH